MPREDEGHGGVLGHLAPLAAVVVREEGEAAVVEHFQQDQPRGGEGIGGGGREDHRVGLVEPRLLRFLKPDPEESERIVAGLLLRKSAHRVFLAHRGERRHVISG